MFMKFLFRTKVFEISEQIFMSMLAVFKSKQPRSLSLFYSGRLRVFLVLCDGRLSRCSNFEGWANFSVCKCNNIVTNRFKL